MPRLVAERLGDRLAEHDADVLDGVVRVDLEVARRRRTARSNSPWRPNASSMWSKNGTPVATSVAPVPSRSSVTVMSVSRVARVDGGRACPCARPFLSCRYVALAGGENVARLAVRRDRSRPSPSRKRLVLLLGADRHAQAVLEPRRAREVADEHRVVVQQVAPERRRVLDAEQHEVRLGREDRRPRRASTARARAGRGRGSMSRMPPRRPRARGRRVAATHCVNAVDRVRLAHLRELADDVLVREQVAHAQPGQRERLGERAQDDEVVVALHVRAHRVRENSKYASSTSTSASVALSRSMRNVSSAQPAGRVVRVGDDRRCRCRPRRRRSSTASSSIEKSASRGMLDDLGAGDLRVDAVHRERRRHVEELAARAAPREQQVEDELVAAVADEHVLGLEAVRLGDEAPQLVRGRIGIAVEREVAAARAASFSRISPGRLCGFSLLARMTSALTSWRRTGRGRRVRARGSNRRSRYDPPSSSSTVVGRLVEHVEVHARRSHRRGPRAPRTRRRRLDGVEAQRPRARAPPGPPCSAISSTVSAVDLERLEQ